MIKPYFFSILLLVTSCAKPSTSVITLQREFPQPTYPILPKFDQSMIEDMDIETRQKFLDFIMPLYIDKQLTNKWLEENKK
jgi:hypothetical protein